MKSVFQAIVVKGKDLEKGDIFFTYTRGGKLMWTVGVTTDEGELHYGVAYGNQDNLIFRSDDIFIVEDINV